MKEKLLKLFRDKPHVAAGVIGGTLGATLGGTTIDSKPVAGVLAGGIIGAAGGAHLGSTKRGIQTLKTLFKKWPTKKEIAR